MVGPDRPRAHSRSIHVPFSQHYDEPQASLLFDRMSRCRIQASKSVASIIKLSRTFEHSTTKAHINDNIFPVVSDILKQFDAPARFTTTMSIFMYFFLEVSHNNYMFVLMYLYAGGSKKGMVCRDL